MGSSGVSNSPSCIPATCSRLLGATVDHCHWVVLSIPGALESVVIGLPHPDFAEVVVVMVSGAQVGWEHVKNTVSAAVDNVKVP